MSVTVDAEGPLKEAPQQFWKSVKSVLKKNNNGSSFFGIFTFSAVVFDLTRNCPPRN